MRTKAISVVEDEVARIRTLLSIESVRLCPPPNRDNDLHCSIYGTISFNDDHRSSNVPVTLYDRPIKNPERIILKVPEFDFLSLSDGDSDRPLAAAPSAPIYLSMKLYERKSSGDDDLIASFENFKFQTPLVDKISKLEVSGNYGFAFEVYYAIVTGVRMQVEVRIDDGGDFFHGRVNSKKRDSTGQVILRKAQIWGHIAASQCFGDDPGDKSTITLNYRYDIAPMMVTIGSTIDLDRKVVIAPVKPDKSLCIMLALNSIDSEVPDIEDDYVRFTVRVVSREDSCSTSNDQLTFTKILYGRGDYVFTVSITFIN